MKTTFTNTPSERDFMDTIMKALQKELPKTQINEKLDPDDADEVEHGWSHERDPHVEDTIDKVFKGKHRIEFPLEHTEEVPHPDVEEHLNNHGIKITDYVGGKAKDKYNREVNIGKALNKTNAPEHIRAAYENDPTRQQKGKQLKVVISHKPVDVAGMTSGHQSWLNQSCMNFKTGVYRGFLPHEVTAGTHVAYLTDHEDNDLDRPVARIAIKPFRNNSGHLIFRPEARTFGDANASFAKSVNDWTETHYPAEANTTYQKDHRVYDDTEDTYKALTPETAINMIENKQAIYGALSPSTVKHIAHHIISKSDTDPSILRTFGSASHRIGFDRNQVNAMYSVAVKHGASNLINRLIGHSGDVLNKKNLDHASMTLNSLHPNILKHRYLSQEYIDGLNTEQYEHVHPANIKPHHIDRVLNDLEEGKSGSAYHARALLPLYSKDHLKKFSDIYFNKRGASDVSLGIEPVISHEKHGHELVDHVFEKIKGITDERTKNRAMMGFTAVVSNPTTEHIAHANDIPALNHIMHNAKSKMIHHLAMHKALGLGNTRLKISLGENSAKYVSEKDIPEIYDNINKFEADSWMDSGIHDKLLTHAEHKISQLQDEYDDGDSERSKDDITEEMQNHFTTHAEMIGDTLSDMAYDHREGYPVNQNQFENLRDHIDHAMEHDHYDGYSHQDVDTAHHQLRHNINSEY